jgi:DNA replication and repair protein RecF
VHLRSLSVQDYRNIEKADIALPSRWAVFAGANAQGKSNLLEAIYMAATMKAVRAETDAQLIRRGAMSGVLPAARVVAEASSADGPLRIEITVMARPGRAGEVSAVKTVKVNGVSRRQSDAVGRITAVLFTAEDMDMVTGSPSGRRRYLDMMLGQVDPEYSISRSRFERLLTQRNSLLKRIREGLAREDELAFWDGELSRHGGLITHRRLCAMFEIARNAAEWHSTLASEESLALTYRPNIGDPGEAGSAMEMVQERYAGLLADSLRRDIAAGMTLSGPHRDDILFEVDELPAAGFASRAQQRTLALSLRLAEVRFLTSRRGEPPVLLLDDILSEMDQRRRETVLLSLGEAEQVIVTSTDFAQFPGGFLSKADLFLVDNGVITPAPLPA